jgi:hypothetical protein
MIGYVSSPRWSRRRLSYPVMELCDHCFEDIAHYPKRRSQCDAKSASAAAEQRNRAAHRTIADYGARFICL